MSLTNDELEARILIIEDTLNDIQTALNALATKRQMKALLNIRQQEIIDLQNQVESLQSQVTALQS